MNVQRQALAALIGVGSGAGVFDVVNARTKEDGSDIRRDHDEGTFNPNADGSRV
jgi:hypothetical protein